MTKHLVAATAAVALCFMAGADKAEARGFHLRAGGVHVDVGNPHGFGRGGHGFGAPRIGYAGYGGVHRSFYGGHGGARWHDTTHLDWHGPSLQRHGNHHHFVPGHYDLHRDGHWDHH